MTASFSAIDIYFVVIALTLFRSYEEYCIYRTVKPGKCETKGVVISTTVSDGRTSVLE
jgi:hypothetical protein